MSTQNDAESYFSANSATLELLFNEASERVASQVELMLASDTRALGLLGASTALAAAAVAIAADKMDIPEAIPLMRAAIVGAIFFVVSASAAIASLWPINVGVRGWHPKLFIVDIQQNREPHRTKAEMIAFMQERIDTNTKALNQNSFLTKASMIAFAASPLAALGAAFTS